MRRSYVVPMRWMVIYEYEFPEYLVSKNSLMGYDLVQYGRSGSFRRVYYPYLLLCKQRSDFCNTEECYLLEDGIFHGYGRETFIFPIS
jgi:hypothetical protein